MFQINDAYDSHATINHIELLHVCANCQARNKDMRSTIRATLLIKTEPVFNAQHFNGVHEAKHAKSIQ